MPEAVVTSRSSRKRRFSEEKQTTCILCNRPCGENKTGFPLDSWNRMREKAIEWQGKKRYGSRMWVLHLSLNLNYI